MIRSDGLVMGWVHAPNLRIAQFRTDMFWAGEEWTITASKKPAAYKFKVHHRNADRDASHPIPLIHSQEAGKVSH